MKVRVPESAHDISIKVSLQTPTYKHLQYSKYQLLKHAPQHINTYSKRPISGPFSISHTVHKFFKFVLKEENINFPPRPTPATFIPANPEIKELHSYFSEPDGE